MNTPLSWSSGLGWPLGFNVGTGPTMPPFPEGSMQQIQAREYSLRGYAEWRAENAKVEAARLLTFLQNSKSGGNSFVPDYMKHSAEHLNNKSFMIDSLLSRQDAEEKIALERGFGPDAQHRRGLNLSTCKSASAGVKMGKGESAKDNIHVYIKGCRVHPYPPKICHHHNRHVHVFQNKPQSTPAMDAAAAQLSTGPSTPAPPDEALPGEKCRDSSPQATRKTTKAKRVRTIFTPEQLEKLEAEFERQQYMVGPERLYLASSLSLSEAQVKVWFQNRRIKWRKQHLELQQQRLAALRSQQADLETEESTEDEDSEPSSPQTASPPRPELSPQAAQHALSVPLPHHLSPLSRAYFYVPSPEAKGGEREGELEEPTEPYSPTQPKVPASPQANGI